MSNNRLGIYLNVNPRWYLTHPLDFFENLYREVRAFIQRGVRGYADCDLWSLDAYLSSWMPEAIDEYIKPMGVYPCDLTYKKWQTILKKIKKGFQANDKIDYLMIGDTNKYLKRYHELEKIQNEGLKLFAKYFDSLWD